MSAPHIILWAVVLVVAVPAAFRNPTAGALVLAYLVAEAGLPPTYFVFPDILTLAVIFCKPDYQPCPRYLSDWHQLKCLLIERSPADRFVMLSLTMGWLFYAPVLSHQQYWALWWIAIAQFLVVGWESLSPILRRRAEAARNQPCSRNGLEVAVG